MDIPESDWRRFKQLHSILQERYCQRAIDELTGILDSKAGDSVERFLKAEKLIRKHYKKLDRSFSDFRRSTAILQLGLMRCEGLLTDEELGTLSEFTRVKILAIESLSQPDPEPSQTEEERA